MALKVFTRKINDASATGGTGTQTLVTPANPGPSYPDSLANACQDGDQIVLCLSDLSGNFEVSNCTVHISGAVVTISRDTVIASSNVVNSVPSAANFSAHVNINNYAPVPLDLVLFNLQYQAQQTGLLTQMQSDISDLKDAMTLLLDGGNP